MPRTQTLDRVKNFTRLSTENIIDPTATARQTRRSPRDTAAVIEVAPEAAPEETTDTIDEPRVQQTRGEVEDITQPQRRSADVSVDNIADPPNAPQRRARRNAMSSGPATRTEPRRQDVRHDPMTRKGRSAFKKDRSPGTQKKKRVRFAVPIRPAEARVLLEKGRRMSGEQPLEKQGGRLVESINGPRVLERGTEAAQRIPGEHDTIRDVPTDDEEMDMDLDSSENLLAYSETDDASATKEQEVPEDIPDSPSESESDMSDKENAAPIHSEAASTNGGMSPFCIYEDAEEPRRSQPRPPLGELPVPLLRVPTQPNPQWDDLNFETGTTTLRGIAMQAENLRRVAAGQPPFFRSSLSRDVSSEPEVSTNIQIPAAPPEPATTLVPAPRTPSPSSSSRRRSYPLSRRPPLEGSDVTLPLPETPDRPSLTVTSPSDDEGSSSDWSPTCITRVRRKELPNPREGVRRWCQG